MPDRFRFSNWALSSPSSLGRPETRADDGWLVSASVAYAYSAPPTLRGFFWAGQQVICTPLGEEYGAINDNS